MREPGEIGDVVDEEESRGGSRRGAAVVGLVAAALAGAAILAFWLASGDPGDELTVTGDLGTIDGVVVESFDGSGEVRLSSLIGQPLVVNFWASWCGPCIEEMPDFQQVYSEMGDDVRFLGIDVQDAPDNARALVESTGVTYPLAADPDASSFKALGGLGMPTTLFVDADGTIVERHTGPLTAAELRSRIRARLGV